MFPARNNQESRPRIHPFGRLFFLVPCSANYGAISLSLLSGGGPNLCLMATNKQPIHPIGSVLQYQGHRLQVFGEYWNGKIDVQYNDGTEAVLTIAQQRRATRINAAPVVVAPTGILRHDPLKVKHDREEAEYAVTVIAHQPERAQIEAA